MDYELKPGGWYVGYESLRHDINEIRKDLDVVWNEDDVRRICQDVMGEGRPSARDHYLIGKLEGEALGRADAVTFWKEHFENARSRVHALEGQLTTTRRLLDEASRRAASLAFTVSESQQTRVHDVALGAVVTVLTTVVCVGGTLAFLAL